MEIIGEMGIFTYLKRWYGLLYNAYFLMNNGISLNVEDGRKRIKI